MQFGGERGFYAAALSHASINLIEYYGTISASSERDNQISLLREEDVDPEVRQNQRP